MFKKLSVIISVLLLASIVLVACGPTETQGPVAPVQVTVIKEGTPQVVYVTVPPEEPTEEPVTRPNVARMNFGPGDVPTIDPNLGTDTSSIQVVDELTIGLTKLDELTLALDPGMAESWTISDDGTVYTFKIRQGIPWVRWDGDKVVEVLDCEGNVRTVTAYDFQYSILRAGNPATASDYAYVLGFAIAGFNDYNTGAVTDTTTVGVKAIDEATLEVTFVNAAVYNLNIIGLWTAHAVPSWIIDGDDCTEARGDRWTEPGFNQSYGPFALKEWIHDSSMTIVKNPFWPGIDSTPIPQLDEVQFYMLDESAAMAEYEAGNLDTVGAPTGDLERVRNDPVLSKELVTGVSGCTYYYGFNTTMPPADNVHMRRALSAALDRQNLIESALQNGGQQPAQWFCNPGSAACPTIDKYPDLGAKSDVEVAKAELQAYMDEMGFTSVDQIPELILMFNTSEGHKKIAEVVAAQWQETLGIKVTVTNQEWAVYLKTVKSAEAPAVWRMGWCLDYPDANNWTREVMSVGGSANTDENGDGISDGGLMWTNPTFEQMVRDAALETDPAKRQDMYAQAEQILVWEDAAIIPIYFYARNTLSKPYLNRTFSVTGHEALEKWSLQQ